MSVSEGVSVYLATDGTRPKEITRTHVTSSDGVMGQLLLHCPVQVLQEENNNDNNYVKTSQNVVDLSTSLERSYKELLNELISFEICHS